MHVFILAADRQVLQAFFMNLCLFEEVSRVETPLIVNYDDIFSCEPFSDLILSFASRSEAHFETYRDALGSLRVVVTPDDVFRGIF